MRIAGTADAAAYPHGVASALLDLTRKRAPSAARREATLDQTFMNDDASNALHLWASDAMNLRFEHELRRART